MTRKPRKGDFGELKSKKFPRAEKIYTGRDPSTVWSGALIGLILLIAFFCKMTEKIQCTDLSFAGAKVCSKTRYQVHKQICIWNK